MNICGHLETIPSSPQSEGIATIYKLSPETTTYLGHSSLFWKDGVIAANARSAITGEHSRQQTNR